MQRTIVLFCPKLPLEVRECERSPLPEELVQIVEVGADLQYAVGRIGTRFEVIRGTRPSTLLSREPEFAEAFSSGTRTSGGAVSGLIRLTSADQLYARYDMLFGDPVTGQNARAANAGYLRFLGERARVGVNYQWKNRPTFNDDAVNTRFQTTFGVVF